ncbi:unnamed protein product [Caenorhabditis bovis]|uniref:Uncharacterized protein n=1 Tax=Caenorhabditis bovis TaxID=2654633 RepID=A0A8S1EBQ0_9PELO|nr:unnamed protein product [Caenorhabditis bovis]
MQYFGSEFVISILLLLIVSVCSLPFEKKADIDMFTSAVNRANRLRYGKRSSSPIEYEESVFTFPIAKKATIDAFASAVNGANRLRYGKRSSSGNPGQRSKRGINTESLVASLNGAERLRYVGRMIFLDEIVFQIRT